MYKMLPTDRRSIAFSVLAVLAVLYAYLIARIDSDAKCARPHALPDCDSMGNVTKEGVRISQHLRYLLYVAEGDAADLAAMAEDGHLTPAKFSRLSRESASELRTSFCALENRLYAAQSCAHDEVEREGLKKLLPAIHTMKRTLDGTIRSMHQGELRSTSLTEHFMDQVSSPSSIPKLVKKAYRAVLDI